ncbi:oxidoreductase [Staphylococcus capitis]|uniref:oxidoreductase n=1 Tax=Staphylococcus capitis TaxID=29388 RepID=UPI00119FF3B0|nr:oxidoreductase [Staphylococcus capitis]
MKKQVVFITGGSSGMGKITANRLNDAGYIVYTGARRLKKMDDLKANGVNILSLDLTNEQSIRKAVDEIVEKEGHIDILINNAGYGSYGALEDVPIEEAKRQFEVNIFGLAKLTKFVLPHMREQRFGKVVNISSIGGKVYEPLGSWYHATKFALEGLSDSLRLEVSKFGIDVIIIEPGGIKTEWSNISADNLLKTSGDTAYADIAHSMSNMFKNSNSGADPDVIAKIIEKALKAKRPKTRYVGGFAAKPMIFIRKLLSDKLFDRFMMTSLKLMGRSKLEIAKIRIEKNKF